MWRGVQGRVPNEAASAAVDEARESVRVRRGRCGGGIVRFVGANRKTMAGTRRLSVRQPSGAARIRIGGCGAAARVGDCGACSGLRAGCAQEGDEEETGRERDSVRRHVGSYAQPPAKFSPPRKKIDLGESPHKSQSGASVTSGSPVSTASKASPGIRFRSPRWSSFQRSSGAPLKYQFEPLSARIMP